MNHTHYQRDIEPGDREQWRRELAAPAIAARHPNRMQLLVFRAGSEWFGLEPGQVAFVAQLPALHTLPQRGKILAGLVSVRGTITLCFSVAAALNCAPGPDNRRPMMIALTPPDWHCACRVEEVSGVRFFDRDHLLAPPANLACAASGHVRGLFADGARSIAWLDPAPLYKTFAEAAR